MKRNMWTLRDTQRAHGHVERKAEVGAMQPQPKDARDRLCEVTEDTYRDSAPRS